MSLPDEPAGAVVALEEPTEPQEAPPEETTQVDDAPPPEDAETEETPEEPKLPETYDEWLERISADETLKAEHEARLDELRQEAVKEGRKAAQSRLQPMVQQRRDSARAAAQALANIEQVFSKAASEGTLDQDTVNTAWQQNKEYAQHLIYTANTVGEVLGAKDVIAHALGGHRDYENGAAVWKVPKDALPLATKYHAELDGILEGRTTLQEVTQDFLDDFVEARIAKAKAPLQAEIKALKAKYVEGGKANTRTGQGTKVVGSAGSRFNSAEAADAAFNRNEIDAQTWKQETERLRGRKEE